MAEYQHPKKEKEHGFLVIPVSEGDQDLLALEAILGDLKAEGFKVYFFTLDSENEVKV